MNARNKKKMSITVLFATVDDGPNGRGKQTRACLRMRKPGRGPSEFEPGRPDVICGYAHSPRAALTKALTKQAAALGRNVRKGHKRYGGR